MSYQETYKKWCTDPYFDAQTQEELKNLEGNEKEIEGPFLPSAGVWNRRTLRNDRSRNQPYEYLYCASGHTGTCQLYHCHERSGQRRCHCP